MLRKLFAFSAAAAVATALGLAASPAAAAVNLLPPVPCDVYTTGCLFDVDNGNTHSQIGAIIAEYNLELDPDLPTDLVYVGKAQGGGFEDADEDPLAGSYTGDGTTSWTFSSLPFTANFFLLKASNDVILFARNPVDFPLTLTNTLITNNRGGAQEISHIDFFYSADLVTVVPEPGTWALMIVGFGAAGSMLRRRRQAATA